LSWTVLVTDGDQRSALATVRSLGRAGHTVHVCSSRGRSLAGASRYCASEHRVPDALRDPDACAAALVTLSAAIGADVLLPVSEPSLLAVLPQRERFDCVIPFASAAQFSAICDKALVLESAGQHAIAVPEQRVVSSPAGASRVGTDLSYPVVLKPSRSVTGPATHRMKVGVLYASDAAELRDVLERMAPETFPVLLQQRVTGPGFAISVLMWNGELRAAFAHRRLREKPPSGGVSVLRESIPLDEELLRRAVALLDGFSWQGVAMVEFKLDSRTGVPYLMEINGRLWGSLQLAVDAGVDFPVLLVRAAMGEGGGEAPAVSYAVGVKTRWELGDADHLLALLRHTPEALHLPPGAPGRLAALGQFIRGFGPGIHQEVFRVRDPWPFLREMANWVSRR
jgi:predicted ATP-grasp superfamily ATP-dependent carboligase